MTFVISHMAYEKRLRLAEVNLERRREWQAAQDVKACHVGARFIGVPKPDPERTRLAFDHEDRIALDHRGRVNPAAFFQRVEKLRQILAELFALHGRAFFINLSGRQFDWLSRFEQQSRRYLSRFFASFMNGHNSVLLMFQ